MGRNDTAMIITPYNLCKKEEWMLDKYYADGIFIENIYNANKNIHIFVDNDLCYYNKIK
jgi:hypothetical protein